MEKKGSYIGKIANKGAQEVKAPLAQGAGKKPSIKKGGDLRTGK